jgi:hypothetical protein
VDAGSPKKAPQLEKRARDPIPLNRVARACASSAIAPRPGSGRKADRDMLSSGVIARSRRHVKVQSANLLG